MSFTPRNVSTLIVAKAEAAVTKGGTVGNFAINEVASGLPVGQPLNSSVNIYANTTNGIKVSGQIIPANITSMNKSAIAVAVHQLVVATYQAEADLTGKTYVSTIVVNDGIGSMLNERFISAYVAVDAAGKFLTSAGVSTTATIETVCIELKAQLDNSILLGNEPFTVALDGTTGLSIAETGGSFIVGANDGIQNPWHVLGGQKDGQIVAGVYEYEKPVSLVITARKQDGIEALKNLEWFTSGYDKDPYRDIAWPASFAADSNIAAAGIATGADQVLIVQYFQERDATNVERQHRQLVVVGAAGVAALETALGVIAPIVVVLP
jgi:hypothetical protein